MLLIKLLILVNLQSKIFQLKLSLRKILPKAESHTSDYIKSFLSYSYQERTIFYDNSLEQSESKFLILIILELIVDEEVKKQKYNTIIEEYEEYDSKLCNELNEVMTTKIDFTES
jgi:hypothetical protein